MRANPSPQAQVPSSSSSEDPVPNSSEPRVGGRPATRRTQARRSAATQELLLAAAVREINSGGAALLTTARVAEEAGLTRGAMQHHYPTPHDLYSAVVERGWGALVNALTPLATEPGTTERRMRAWVRAMLQAYSAPDTLAAFQLMLARQGDGRLVIAQQQLLQKSENELHAAWASSFGEGTHVIQARIVLRDAIIGDLARRTVARLPEDTSREHTLVQVGLALLAVEQTA